MLGMTKGIQVRSRVFFLGGSMNVSIDLSVSALKVKPSSFASI